jgi:hypothetical protein
MTTTKTPAERAHEAQERRAFAEHGLELIEARICPRVFAGKDCCADSDTLCACQRHRRLLDHGRVWLDQEGCPVLTGEPYDADGADLADFVADMTALGLRVALTGRSPWYPGHTFLILIRVDSRHDPDDTP